MDKEAKKAVSIAKSNIVISHPFWASLLLRLDFDEDLTIPTACTDGRQVLYNPEWAKKLSFEELKGVLAHEAGHNLLLHFARQGSREHGKWNRAADYALNQIIEEGGFTLPKGRLRDGNYDGKSAEQIYSLLPDDPGDKGGKPGNDPGGCGGVMAPKNGQGKKATPKEIEQLEGNWKVAGVQAANIAKKMGKLPAGLSRLVEELTEPRLPIAQILSRFICEVAKNDYSWMRPNRRYISQGVYLPSLYNEELGEIVFVIDTSGSISKEDLMLVAGVLQNVLAHFRKGFTAIYVDADVAGTQEFGPEDDLNFTKLQAKGGGGTSYVPGFEWLEKEGREPKAVVYLTDGYCNSFPKKEPPFPTLWILTAKNPSFKAPWGEVAVANGE